MRIAIFSLNADPFGRYGDQFNGGQSKYVKEVSAYLVGRGWEVDIVTIAADGNAACEAITEKMQISRVPLPEGKRLTYQSGADDIRRILPNLCGAINDPQSVQLLLSCYWLSAIPALEMQTRYRTPHVFSMCSSGLNKQLVTGTSLAERISVERSAVAMATATIATTHSEMATLVDGYGASPDRIVSIGRGIDLERFRRRTQLLYVGRSTWSKGLDVLFSALGGIGEDSWNLTMVGPTEIDISSLGIDLARFDDRVRILGRQPNECVAQEMARADVLVIPSRYETFGNVALEAMAASVAVVAARVGGLADLVSHGTSGFLFEAGDSGDLAAKIRLTLADPVRLARMGQSGRERAASFAWDVIGQQTDEAMQRLIRATGRGLPL